MYEALLPTPDDGFGFAGPAHNLGGAATIGSGQNNLSAPDMFLRRTTIRNDAFKAKPIFARNSHSDP
jgi:hypothetical protein